MWERSADDGQRRGDMTDPWPAMSLSRGGGICLGFDEDLVSAPDNSPDVPPRIYVCGRMDRRGWRRDNLYRAWLALGNGYRDKFSSKLRETKPKLIL